MVAKCNTQPLASGRAGFSDLDPPDGGWSQNPAGTVFCLVHTGSDHFGFLIYVSWKMMGWVLVMAGVLLALRCLRMWLLRSGQSLTILMFKVKFAII